jgi:hypothetical protein
MTMRIQWLGGAILGVLVLVGCGGGQDASQTPPADGAMATGADASGAPALQPADDAAAAPGSGAPAPSGTNAPAAAPAPVAPPPGSNAAAPSAAAPAASAPPPPAAPVIRTVTLPAGSALPLELTSAVSTETATVEMPVTARLRRAVSVDGVTVLPAGATVSGEVVDVERPGRVQGRARLGLRFTSVTVDGRRESIRTNPVTFQGEATKGEDATKIGGAAGIGAVVGGLIGGGDGAAKGAAIGGAAGTGAVLATRGRDLTLGAGADVNATLASAVEFEVP